MVNGTSIKNKGCLKFVKNKINKKEIRNEN